MEETVSTIGDSLITIYTSRTDDTDRQVLAFPLLGSVRKKVCVRSNTSRVMLDKERILHIAGRMVLGEIQGREDMPVVLDFRSLSDAES